MHLDAIGIIVASFAASVRFYRLVGLAFPDAAPDEVHIEAVSKGGLRVMLDSEAMMRQLNPAWTRPAGQAMALAFHCGSPAGVDEAYRAILAAGFRGAKEPWDAVWGQRYASVLDPDGNSVDLFAPL